MNLNRNELAVLKQEMEQRSVYAGPAGDALAKIVLQLIEDLDEVNDDVRELALKSDDDDDTIDGLRLQIADLEDEVSGLEDALASATGEVESE